MRSRTWSRRLWKSQLLLLFFIGAAILWHHNVEFVAGEEANEDANPDGTADPASEDDGTLADTTSENADPTEDPTTTTEMDPTLSSTGKCSEEIKKFCDLESETAFDCISKKLKDVSDECEEKWRDTKVAFYRVSLEKKLGDKCKKDIEDICSEHPEGGVLGCLRDGKEGLSQSCQDQIFEAEQEAVDDFRMDPFLIQVCSADAAKYCKGIKHGEGRVQACMRNHSEISYKCRAQLFRQERENADDLRLNPELFEACSPAQKKFCPGVHFGKARVKDCMESHRLEPDFPAACKTEFDKMIARRSADFRLNPTLKAKCADDIKLLCNDEKQDSAPVQNDEPKIIHCLQDYREGLHDECKIEVHKLLALAAEDYRFDKEFSDSCEAYKQKFCPDIENDKVLSCLQSKREQLDNKCRAAVFNMEWRLSGDIDYKFAMKQACVMETGKFCHGRRHDRGAIIECLQEMVDDPDMGADCRTEIVADQVESAKDFRLNYRIYEDCKEDVKTLCPAPEKCNGPEPCGGVVLQCLQEKVDKLSSEDCKKDVISFEIKESKNVDLNIPFQQACSDDLLKFCTHGSKDHSKSLTCLRRNRIHLKQECKDEELRFSMMEASDIRLTPSLMNACGTEIRYFCPKVSPTNGEAFKCLQLNLESMYMGVPCKVEVDLQGARQASDYRLDVRVRTECKEDVNEFCSVVSKEEDGHAQVLKCFVNQFKNLTGGCQSEVAYAVRMALFEYKLESNLTFPCDEVVRKSCDSTEAKPIYDVVSGTYMQCLFTQKRRTLNPDCRSLVRVATRDGSFLNGTTTDADIAAALVKYKELIRGDDLSHSGLGLFWVTTMVAFVAVIAVALFRRYSGPPKTYTLVVKQGDV